MQQLLPCTLFPLQLLQEGADILQTSDCAHTEGCMARGDVQPLLRCHYKCYARNCQTV
jgi:hypothetical protein